MFAVIVASHIRMRAMIIARGLMCEATMTKNTGLNSIISWVVDLNVPFIANILVEASIGS